MKTPPRALIRAFGAIVTTEGDFSIVTCGEEDVRKLRQALSDGAAGIALSGCRTAAEVQRLAVLLSVAEAEMDRPDGSTLILALTDGVLAAPQAMAGASPRLLGLAWDARLLADALDAFRQKNVQGEWTGAFAAARAAVLLAATAAGLPAYDSPCPLRGEALLADCRHSRDDGFYGRLSDEPGQIEAIESLYGEGRSISKTSEASQ